MKIKAQLVPKHYTLNATLTGPDVLDLIVALRQYEREFEVSENIAAVRQSLEDAYEGDIPEPPGEPINEDAPVTS